MERGRRERKKEATRDLIAVTARRLFAERGFDRVTVAQIATEADVAQKTVFNHFASKDELFYYGMETVEGRLLATIRERLPGQSVVDAFRSFLLEPPHLPTERKPMTRRTLVTLREVSAAIASSPALLAREQDDFARCTDLLASLIAEEPDSPRGELQPWVVANALMGVYRALVLLVRRRVLAGDDDTVALARDARREATRALALLDGGLGNARHQSRPRVAGGGRGASRSHPRK